MKTTSELIAERCASDPDKIFCYFEDEQLTFKQLADRVKAAAVSLHRVGIGTGDRVGLMLDNHPDHIVLCFALAWLGAIHIPISVHLKNFGLAHQLKSADLSLIIAEARCQAELGGAMPDAARPTPVVWRGRPAADRPSGPSLDVVLDGAVGEPVPYPGDLDRWAMVSYTSGTTGGSKGVMLTERYLQFGAHNAAILADIQSDDVLYLWEPFSHLAGWMTVLMSLQHGVPTALVGRFSASRCWDEIRRFGATKFHYLGGVINILLKQRCEADDSSNPVQIAWGAAAPSANWATFEKRFGLRIREGYGLTEAGNFTFLNLDGPVGSIGKPIPEFDAWISGEDGEPLGPGAIGEIVLRPKQDNLIMRGYFRDPDATARTIRNGAVHTGDLGYRDDDGFFYFTGRMKERLRRRGENISAWELEQVINAHPKVLESAVIGVPSDLGEDDIKVFIRPGESETVSPEEIMSWCEDRLAYYQMPRYLEFIADFPRGPTQRIQKAALATSIDCAFDAEKARRPGRSGG